MGLNSKEIGRIGACEESTGRRVVNQSVRSSNVGRCCSGFGIPLVEGKVGFEHRAGLVGRENPGPLEEAGRTRNVGVVHQCGSFGGVHPRYG